MSVVERIRQDHEDLARVLKKHAGIRKIVEDLYPDTAHFIYELLQNAEDTGASKATFALSADRIVFEHNGRPFEEGDVRAITDIGEGTKAEDDDQIGRFGIGFKAVFAYTETPRIWSPTYAFEISEMVLPSEIPSNPSLKERTRFEFPFNSTKKSCADAFSEVSGSLEGISEKTLLFLSNIEDIQWRMDDGQEGRLLRIHHPDHHIEILREIDGGPSESAHFLRFTEPVQGLESQYTAVAFELEPSDRDDLLGTPASFSKKFRIVPAERGCVAVYFTAEKETSNLRFHLHAPFVPEISRASVKDTPANEPLFRQLAALAAQSLTAIRDLGLLDREFLTVLPNSQDEIPSQYAPIRGAIVAAMNEQPLTPRHISGHAPASRLLQAEAGLKDLMDRDDIRFLRGGDNDPRDGWAIAPTQRNSCVDRFLRDLDIEKWDVEQFVETLDDRFSNKGRLCYSSYSTYTWKQGPDRSFLDWMRRKPTEWHRTLYALFYREFQDKLHRFDDICIVRRSDGKYGTGRECYFPTTETRDDPIHPRVEENTYTGGGTNKERADARKFLKGIGVREVGKREQVEAILKQRYSEEAKIPDKKTHRSDLIRFIDLVEDDPRAAKLFEDYWIFERADSQWGQPAQVYLDAPYSDTGLHAFFKHFEDDENGTHPVALSDSYSTGEIILGKLVAFVKAVGAATRIGIKCQSTHYHARSKILRQDQWERRTHYEIDKDWTIKDLKRVIENSSEGLSRLIWITMVGAGSDKLEAQYRPNKQHSPRTLPSTLVLTLQNAAWIPQRDSEFVRPAEALRDLLPDGFPFDAGWPWIKAIRFGEENVKRAEERRRNQEMADELGFRDEAALADGR